MVRRTRVYKIKLPLDIKEWRKGSRYVLCKMTTDNVKIILHRKELVHGMSKTITHKILDLRNKMPFVIKKIVPEKSMIMDEYSTNIDSFEIGVSRDKSKGVKEVVYNIVTKLKNEAGLIEKMEIDDCGVIEKKSCEKMEIDDCGENKTGAETEKIDRANEIVDEVKEIIEKKKDGSEEKKVLVKVENELKEMINYCDTIYRSKHFDTNTFRLNVKTIGTKKDTENPFSLTCKYKDDNIDFRTYNKGKMYKVGNRDYSGDWTEKYPVMYLYKYIDVEINSFGFGWITKEIDKMLRNFLVDVQRKIIETYNEWIGLTDEEMDRLEKEMVSKFITELNNE